MDEFTIDFNNISSMADLDLAMMGFGAPEPEPSEKDGEPEISPYHDMDSLEFHLWIEEEAQKTYELRQAEKAAAKAAEEGKQAAPAAAPQPTEEKK